MNEMPKVIRRRLNRLYRTHKFQPVDIDVFECAANLFTLTADNPGDMSESTNRAYELAGKVAIAHGMSNNTFEFCLSAVDYLRDR